MPKPFPSESRREVVAMNRKGEASISQVARTVGISKSCMRRWLEIADRDDGLAPPANSEQGGGSTSESAEARESRRRDRLLEQEDEVLRRPASPAASSPN